MWLYCKRAVRKNSSGLFWPAPAFQYKDNAGFISQQPKLEETMSCTNNRESADLVPVPTIGPQNECPPSRSDGTTPPIYGGEGNAVCSGPGSESVDVYRGLAKGIKEVKSQNKRDAKVSEMTDKIY